MTRETPLRIRGDLEVIERRRGVQSEWIVKDPVSFSHFLFSREEIGLLRLFDGERSLEEVRADWQKQFCSVALTLAQVKSFSQRLVRDNLVLVERIGSGRQYFDVRVSSRRRQRIMKLSSPMVIKFGGIDPTRLLDFLRLPGKLIFSRWMIAISMLFSLTVFGYFLSNIEEIAQQLPTMSQFFAPKNMLAMIAVLVFVKVIHEIGHALACRKYGGECLEIGVILLAFFPTLYCDVSDSWTFRERWKRMMVSFAGIYVEILLASICALIWLLTDPGFIHSVSFNVAIMCSLNTLFVNGNPLLKYDGYYLVSDLFEQPNLAQRARLNFRTLISQAYLDVEEPRHWNGWLALFGGLSAVYRWVIVCSIVGGVYVLSKSFGFGFVSESIAVVLIAAVGFRMISQQKAEKGQIKGRLNLGRATVSCLILVGGLLLFFWMPLSSHVYCRFEIQSETATMVYAPQDGQLQNHVTPDSIVKQGELIASVTDESREFELKQAESRLLHLRDRQVRIERQIAGGSTIVAEFNIVKKEIVKQQNELRLLRQENDKRKMFASEAGVVRKVVFLKAGGNGAEAKSSFAPLLAENNQCFVRRGQPLFSIATGRPKIIAVVGEQSVDFLDEGQPVVLKFNQHAGAVVQGVIQEIAEVDVRLSDHESERMGLDTTIDQAGNTSTVETPYRLLIEVEQLPEQAFIGSAGHARIAVQSRTAAQKIWYVVDRWWNEQNY